MKPLQVALLPFAVVAVAIGIAVMFCFGLAHMCVNRVTMGRWWL